MNQKKRHDITDLIKNQYGSDVYELVQLYSKLNEAGKNKIMEELRDTAALPKYTEPVKGMLKKWHNIPNLENQENIIIVDFRRMVDHGIFKKYKRLYH